ncbi:MAG: hypothetical protein ACFCD0_06625 [Gemmataceae bacterium]
MAASDQFYRNQKTLNVIFAVSSVGMLFSIMLMFYFDHNRPWKAEQRTFYDVEEALAQRLALETLPSETEFQEAVETVEQAKKDLDQESIESLQKQIDDLVPLKDKANLKYQNLKATFDSLTSFYHIAVDKHGKTSSEAQEHRESLEELSTKLDVAQSETKKITNDILFLQKQLADKREPLTMAITNLNKLHDKFDSAVRLAAKKRWGGAHLFRGLPILDGFASPVQVKQFTIRDIPIDYNFAHVTRFDRCMTCHLGIGKSQFTRENLRELTEEPSTNMRIRFGNAVNRLKARRKALEGTDAFKLLPTPEDLKLSYLKKSYLTETRINQFCAHPRLDLYVGPNSPHPAEKFGCTSCHRGQGSGVQFNLSSHDPDNHLQHVEWKKKYGWDRNHYWDFPMLPKRFIEASCVKCHHEMTDLITVDNRNEAPKLLHGYNTVKQVGCYGCHDINGWKEGRRIGPDLRLEPSVPYEELSKAEKEKIDSDPNNNPGKLRKVGPSLYRLAEKTSDEWTAKWLRSPRSFRPDTKMPHFYGLSNNDASYLPEDQKEFPDTEIRAITYYLFRESEKHLESIGELQEVYKKDAGQRIADESLVARLAPKKRLAREEKEQYDEARSRLRLSQKEPQLTRLVGTDEKQWAELKKNAHLIEGRKLFTEKGCLACHQHASTAKGGEEKAQVDGEDQTLEFPDVKSEAVFGPDLSQIKEKLVWIDPSEEKQFGQVKAREMALERARVWLSNWLKNPNIHSARTKMPIVPMTDQENLHIVEWLLEQEATGLGVVDEVPVIEGAWTAVKVAEPKTEVYYDLAKVYLKRVLSADRLAELDEHRAKVTRERLEGLKSKEAASLEGEEAILNRLRMLSYELPPDEGAAVRNYGSFDKIKHYVGKKAVGRLGCYGCHAIPGFDNAKLIGVGLNDWGKKDPERLAFEDAHAFVKSHYDVTPAKVDKNGNPYKPKFDEVATGEKSDWTWKYPYEEFFETHLHHHHRLGYLHQKLVNPRSYDYNRVRAWDDRSRMPKFKFARTVRRKGQYVEDEDGNKKWQWTEGEEEFKARRWKAEADAREAVMTFVLGLVAEEVPPQRIHQPKGDELARVKGRQVLEKYNCAGCHVIRPGMYELEMDEKKIEEFLAIHTSFTKKKDDYNFTEHTGWYGRENRGTGDTRKMYGLFQPQLKEGKLVPHVFLTEAFRFNYTGKDKNGKRSSEVGNVRTSLINFQIDPKKLQYPPRKFFESDKDIKAYMKSPQYGKYGGAFLDLLVRPPTNPADPREKPGYLMQMYPKYKTWPYAAFAAPPWLIGQGARTQPDWLHKFLLNPFPVRADLVLRMPKFNMSSEEAKILVDYFAAVERLTNPRSELEFPYPKIPQKEEFDATYWLAKNSEYVDRLKQTKVEGTNTTYYDQRLKLFRPIWKDLAQEQLEALNSKLETAKQQLKKADQAIEANKAEVQKYQKEYLGFGQDDKLSDEQKKKKQAALKKLTEASTRSGEFFTAKAEWTTEKQRLEKVLKDESEAKIVAEFEEKWNTQNAYIVDSYRLVGADRKNLCVQCHQVGKIIPQKDVGKGPPLFHANERLRPDWTKRWIANPMRIFPHSVMPAYFPKDKNNQYQQWFVGSAREQVDATRDFLMVYDRALQLPTNRKLVEVYRQPSQISITKKGG